jgi:hypothetical protein
MHEHAAALVGDAALDRSHDAMHLHMSVAMGGKACTGEEDSDLGKCIISAAQAALQRSDS